MESFFHEEFTSYFFFVRVSVRAVFCVWAVLDSRGGAEAALTCGVSFFCLFWARWFAKCINA